MDFASERDGDFWAEAAVLAHAARCSPHYLATTRPDRWSFHRELHASVAGTESVAAGTGAGQESEIPNFKGSFLGRFPLVSADFWTSDHLSERSRSVDAFFGTRARGTLMLKRR